MSDRRRILVLLKTLGIGGAETLVLESARLWDRERFDYRLGYLGGSWELADAFSEANFSPVCFSPFGWSNDPFCLVRLATYLHKERIDLVHAHLPVPTLMAAAARRGTAAKLVATNHSGPHAMRMITRRIASRAWAQADAVIAVADEVADSTRSAQRVEVVPNGVNLTRFEGITPVTLPGVPPDASVVLVLGSLVERKRPVPTLRVFEAALARSHAAAYLAFAGDGPLRADLELCVARSPARERVRVLGPRRDIPALIARASVVMLLSRAEGLPMALLEGAAGGNALLATDVDAVGELIEDDETGFVVRTDEEAAGRLATLLADPALAQRLGAAARERVAGRFSLSANVGRIESLYDELLGERP